ncbi:helix-turn-helix transcriptional regulator [Actinomadura sp. DC4]|uniref:helix-turn-helix domain-containing protein n=1 Tax=Actinomadura sp. DC4 TaxID=3055069 RepID=UPI0025AF27AE|nr:helix-turn-helix transcriptional regulator [Actinomadura sp. DC4]MDN3359193.1 helix-turn-helix transcriptional regulator [Actinomadura sp. DC4]
MHFYREKAGLTQADLAARLYCSDSLISSIETGHAPATEDFAKAADRELDSDGALFRLLDWRKGASPYPSWFIDWLPAEQKAGLIRWFEVALIPGLLQTEEYARVMLGDETDVAARLSRQAILTREDPSPVEFYCVLDEAVLRRNIGGAAVMYEQCQHLAKMGETENISVRVVPSRRHRGARGPFAIATLEGGAQVAHTETAFGGVVSTRTEDIATATASWEAISSASLPEDMSRDMIMRIAEELWKTP